MERQYDDGHGSSEVRYDPSGSAEEVVGLPFDQFLVWFKQAWMPGEHVALVGPTGEGKSTFAGHILKQRKYVIAYDAKGGDHTLADFGFRRIGQWPLPKQVLEDIASGLPVRINLGHTITKSSDWLRNRRLFAAAIDGVFEMGHWTEYWDEYQLMTDRKMKYRFGPMSEEHLIAARDKGISNVNSFQAPAWVPSAATRQSTWLAAWRTKDVDVIDAMANKMGRDKKMMRQLLPRLPKFTVIVGGKDPFEPLVLTSVPRL